MKKVLAIAIVMLFTAFAAQAQDNCTASATGTFSFAVEQAIGLSAQGQTNFDLGGICPGCSKDFTDMCAAWTVTGGSTCTFAANVSSSASPSLPPTVVVTSGWEYMDESGLGWEPFNGTDHDGLGNFFYIDNTAHSGVAGPTSFRVCVTNIATTCNDVAQSYVLSYTLAVNYVCSLL